MYGSQGASLYLGAFKEFGDIDLLVPDEWVSQDWSKLVTIMQGLGFALVDEREHEFTHSSGTRAAFAGRNILIRDGILESLDDCMREFEINGVSVQSLKPEIFKKAYEFSVKDGYRKDIRGKKDRQIIELFEKYLA